MDNIGKESIIGNSIAKIENEYKKIDSMWLFLHYKISVILVLFALMVECVMSILIVNTEILNTTLTRYIIKYIVIPSGLNFLCIAVDTVVIKSKKITQNQKRYIISFVFVIMCFIIFSAHSTFSATYYIFTAAIMLTTIYANYYITSMTALMCFFSIIISEIFVKWDSDKVSIFQSAFHLSDFLVSLIMLVSFYIISLIIIQFEQKKNEASIQIEIERKRLEQSIQEDEMTGIYNRRALQDALKNVEEKASDDTYILTIIDVDNFKGINDSWGHHNGDRSLKAFSKILKENSKDYIPFRYGGDEFCLLFHNVTMNDAKSVCEKIRSELQEIRIKEQPEIRITASFGLAVYKSEMDAVSLFAHSDYALYKAKETRNNIQVYHKEEDDHYKIV